MNGDVAAARAFLEAGNTKLALDHVEKVLTERPDAREALEVYCDILLKLDDLVKLEKVAVDWIGKRPTDPMPYLSLLVCYARRDDKKMASALLEHFKSAFPHNAEDVKLMEALYQTRFGDKQSGYTQLAKSAGERGDKRNEFTYSAYVALAKANLSEAIKEAEYARRTGETTPENAALLAMLNFRIFRFEKCTMYARMALKDRPNMPIPLELTVLSWLVLFPPFFLAHAGLALLTYLGRSGAASAIALVVAIPLSVPAFGLTEMIMRQIGLGGWPTAILIVAWAFYAPYIGSVAQWLYGGKPKDVELADY
jgi:tetratricopeptide (TPR) repeat protein